MRNLKTPVCKNWWDSEMPEHFIHTLSFWEKIISGDQLIQGYPIVIPGWAIQYLRFYCVYQNPNTVLRIFSISFTSFFGIGEQFYIVG